MKTNYLKKAFAALAVSAVAVSATSVSAFAADEIRGADNGFTADEIATSTIKPTVSVDKVTLTLAEAQELVANNTPVDIAVTVSGGTDGLWAPTGMHFDYDSRLSIVTKRTGDPKVELGDGGADLSLTTEKYTNGVFCTTSAKGDYGFDGVLYTISFNLPADVAAGDKYPIDIVYRSAPNAVDKFTNAIDDRTGQLMQAWVFTQGLDNGWIEIKDDGTTTTTTTSTTTTTTTSTTTTSKSTTTSTSTSKSTTTTSSTSSATSSTSATSTSSTTSTTTTTNTNAPNTGTTTSGSTSKAKDDDKTTTNKTTSSKDNSSGKSSPKTGVAGVGVAAAGLAVAIGTAFVLRKKND